MEFLSPQLPDDVRHRLEWASRTIPDIAHPDALLAHLLHYEDVLPPAANPALHLAVAREGRALDTRVLEVIGASPCALVAAGDNPHLDPAAAEWLAVRHLASIVPATTLAEWDMNRAHRGAFQRLVVRRALSATGLAGRVLFREACASAGEHVHLAQQALSLYLHFPDVPQLRLERLAALWREHEWGSAQLQAYRPRIDA